MLETSGFTSALGASAASSGAPALPRDAGPTYRRRDVESTALYQVVRDHVETFYAAVEEGAASAPLPAFVREEFEDYLDCGAQCRAAALLVCEECSVLRSDRGPLLLDAERDVRQVTRGDHCRPPLCDPKSDRVISGRQA